MVQFAHNNWPSDTTRKSPFFLLMGYNPHADWKHTTSPLPQVTLRVDQFKEARAQAQNLMIKAQKSWVKHRDTPKYKEGDLVWLEGKNLRTTQPMPKLGARRHGPFKVIQVMSPVNYWLELPMQWSIHPVFHINLLTPYRETITHGTNYQHPLPDLVDNAEEYEVKKILDSRLFGRRWRLQYLVKWKGYPDLDNMWVNKDDIFADDKVRTFKESNPEARMHLRATQSTIIPHFPLASPRSSSASYFAPHIQSMSSNGHSDLHYEPQHSAHAESPPPHLVLDLSLPETLTLLTPSDFCGSALCPSIQSNLPKLQVSLLIRDPSLPSLGMQTAIAWRREQLLAVRQRMDECNRARCNAGMIPVTWTTSQILNTAIDAMVPWSTAMDTTLPTQYQYQHPLHLYLSDLPTRHIEKWPEFASHTRTSPHWRLKLPDLSTKTTKIPWKYRHPLSSQQMKGLPKGWVYTEDDEVGKHEELRNLNQYSHLPPRLILAQHQLMQQYLSNRLRDSSTTLGKTSSHSPSPTSTESQPQRSSSKSI